MVISLVSNPAAVAAQSRLNETQQSIVNTTAQLTSGNRVFSAQEDASSLAIGAGLGVEIAALNSAINNTSTGISMLQVAEGALQVVQDLILRMKELALQASSGNLGDAERALLQQEYANLGQEIDRIAADTSFNGQPLIAGGSAFSATYASTIQAQGIRSPEFDGGLIQEDQTFRITYDSTTEQLTAQRIDGGGVGTQIMDVTNLLDDVAGIGQDLTTGETVSVNFSALGLSVTLDELFSRGTDILPALGDASGADIALTPAAAAISYSTTGVTLEGVTALSALGTAYNSLTGQLTLPITTDGAAVMLGAIPGIRYDVNSSGLTNNNAPSDDLVGVNTQVDIYVVTASGEELLTSLAWDAVATTGTTDGTLTVDVGAGLLAVDHVTSGGGQTLSFMVGTGANASDFIDVTIQGASTTDLQLGSTQVTSVAFAESAMAQLDGALTQILQQQSSLGADQSRLEFVALQLATSLENNTLSRATLLDTDVAQSITDLEGLEVQSQVSISILTRLNTQPQRLLELLRSL